MAAWMGDSENTVKRIAENNTYIDTRDEYSGNGYSMKVDPFQNSERVQEYVRARYTVRTTTTSAKYDRKGRVVSHRKTRTSRYWDNTSPKITLFESGEIGFTSANETEGYKVPAIEENKNAYFELLVKANDKLKKEGLSLLKRTSLVNDTTQSIFTHSFSYGFETKGTPFKNFLAVLDKGGHKNLEDVFLDPTLKDSTDSAALRNHFATMIGLGGNGDDFKKIVLSTLEKTDLKATSTPDGLFKTIAANMNAMNRKTSLSSTTYAQSSSFFTSFANEMKFSNPQILEHLATQKCGEMSVS